MLDRTNDDGVDFISPEQDAAKAPINECDCCEPALVRWDPDVLEDRLHTLATHPLMSELAQDTADQALTRITDLEDAVDAVDAHKSLAIELLERETRRLNKMVDDLQASNTANLLRAREAESRVQGLQNSNELLSKHLMELSAKVVFKAFRDALNSQR